MIPGSRDLVARKQTITLFDQSRFRSGSPGNNRKGRGVALLPSLHLPVNPGLGWESERSKVASPRGPGSVLGSRYANTRVPCIFRVLSERAGRLVGPGALQ